MRIPAEQTAPRPTTLRFLPPVLVMAVTFIAFLPVLDAGFVNWDDDVLLVNNVNYRGLGLAQLRWMFTTTLLGHWVPFTWLSWALNYALGGMDPRGYHLGNLLLHAASAGLFYFVARRLLTAAFGDERGISVGALIAALAFGVHPLRVESVAWVTERRDVLCGFFFLLAALAYLRGAASGDTVARPWRELSLGAFAAALLSKAAAMPLGAALLVLDVYPLRRVAAVGWPRLLVEKVPYLVLGGASALVALVAQTRAEAVTQYSHHGIGARLAMTAYGLVYYPWKFVWAGDLAPLEELPARVDPLSGRFVGATLALLLVTAALVLLRRRWPGGLAAWVYSAIMVLPVTGAVVHAGVQLVASQYSYLSGLGFAVLMGAGITWLSRERAWLKPSVVALCVTASALVVLGWGAGAWRQSKIWHDSETLWRRALADEPDCSVCSMNLAEQLMSGPIAGGARLAEAEALFHRAITLRPDRNFAYHGLGVSLALQRRYGEAEAAFQEYARREPSSAIGPADLGLLRLDQHRYGEAIPLLRRALAMSPGYPGLASHLARALRGRVEELRREGNPTEAEALLAEADALVADVPGSAARAV